ncbi:hypothetical protein [Pontibacter pamirensis]|nr:hypothetical protein [Pontibacter pamirensis]
MILIHEFILYAVFFSNRHDAAVKGAKKEHPEGALSFYWYPEYFLGLY